MRIDKFLKNLIPSFKKDVLREELANVRKEISDNTIPQYASALEVFARHKFSSKEVLGFERGFDRAVKTEFRGNFVTITYETLKRIVDNMPVLERLVERSFVEDVFRDALTYLRANVIQYLEQVGFVAKYARRLMIWVSYEETQELDKKSGIVGQGPTKAEIKWLLDNASAFYMAINSLAVKKQVVEKAFSDIPDAIVTEEGNAEVEATVGADKTDPFKFGFVAHPLNPFYLFGKIRAERQVKRYESAKEEARLLELRLLNMRQRQAGNTDPKLQQNIEYSEDRLQKLNIQIQDMEEDYLR